MVKEFDYVGDFKEGLAMAVKNGKYGFINTRGEEIVECKFDFISTFYEGFASLKKDSKYGIKKTKGKEVIECKIDNFD